MNDNRDELNILAPREMKPKLDYLHREVQRAAGAPHQPARGARAWRDGDPGRGGGSMRRHDDNDQQRLTESGWRGANPLTHKPLENHLEIYNWSQYDDPSTFTKFTKLPAEAKVGHDHP